MPRRVRPSGFSWSTINLSQTLGFTVPGHPDSPPPADPERLLRLGRRYQALADAEGSIVWVVDSAMRPTGRNEAWERYSGQTPEQYAERGWIDAIHPDDRSRFATETAEAQETGGAVALEFRIRRADGEYRRNLVRALPIREQGRVVEWIGTATDVEEARRATDEQRELRARLLALTDGAEHLLVTRDLAAAQAGIIELAQRVLPGDAHATWSLDTASREWRISQSVGLSAEYATQRLQGDTVQFTDPLALDDVSAARILEDRRTAYDAEGIKSILTIPVPVGGERRATLVVYHRTPHVTTDTELRVGVAVGHLAAAALWNAETHAALRSSMRTAERHAAQMAFLAEASARLGSLDYETTLREVARLAVPGLTDWCAVDVVQPDGAVERLITAHIDPAKVELALTLQERYPPRPDAGVPQVLRTGEPIHYPLVTDEMLAAGARDAEHLRILRELGLHSAALVPLTARGRTLGVITFVSASAERPLTADDVTVLAEVGRRAGLAVDNARLYRDAEVANTAKDDFLALLSHELRTPLNAIMGWAHILGTGAAPELASHAIDVIARNARSQKQLVEDLLDVARIAGGRLDLRRTVVDLREVGRIGVDSALPTAHAKGITLSLEAPGEPLPVDGDPERLQQVIANLLSNAVKFTEAGGRVTVRVRRTGEGIELSVQDTGSGIAADFLPNVFDRFRQADTSLTRPYGGLGLGLWVVKQIADAHGARVKADSAGEGQGTTVIVTWPAAP